MATQHRLENEIYFGSCRGNIVGKRYYQGSVNNNEMVSLIREPHNPFDANALRVDNVHGVQVGHIKRELARPLADVVDFGLARLKGVVPYGANHVYYSPCNISFWGRPENNQDVLRIMHHHGYILRTFGPDSPSAVTSVSRLPSNTFTQDQRREPSPGPGATEGTCCICLEVGIARPPVPCCSAPIHEACLLDWLRKGKTSTCPHCRARLPEDLQRRLHSRR
ncbi:helicase-like transcription factor isoform X2 [Oculina patagonica]